MKGPVVRRHGILALSAAAASITGACGSDDTDAADADRGEATTTTVAPTPTEAESGTDDAANDLAPAVERLGEVQFMCADGLQVTTVLDHESATVEVWDGDHFGIIIYPTDAAGSEDEDTFGFSFAAVTDRDTTLIEWDADDGNGPQWYSVEADEVDLESWSSTQFEAPLWYSCGGIVWDDYVSSLWAHPPVFADPDDPANVIVDLSEYNVFRCATQSEEVGPDTAHLGELGLALSACPTEATNLGESASDFDLRELRDAGSRLIISTSGDEVSGLDLWLHNGVYGLPQRIEMSFESGPTGLELPSEVTELDADAFHELTYELFRFAPEE